MNKLVEIIKSTIGEILTEIHTYDELLSLNKWRDEEDKKLENIKDFKKWKLKTKLLQKEYLSKKNEI